MKTLLGILMAMPLIALGSSAAKSADFDQAHHVMKEIAIKNIVSDDRKLPKKDHIAWEQHFSAYVDFDGFNENLRARVRKAAEAHDEGDALDPEHVRMLEDKAVRFLGPRTLLDSTLAFLRFADRVKDVGVCTPNRGSNEPVAFCTDAISSKEFDVRVVQSGKSIAFRFRKSDRLRLIDIEVPVTEETLLRLAYWK